MEYVRFRSIKPQFITIPAQDGKWYWGRKSPCGLILVQEGNSGTEMQLCCATSKLAIEAAAEIVSVYLFRYVNNCNDHGD